MSRKLPEGDLNIDFVICDNSINRYKWRLLVEGIDTEGFSKNPVCCLQHNTYMVPVGKWSALTAKDGVFTGTLTFDRNDEEAVKLYWKYKDGFMSAVSLNILPIATDDSAELLLDGQLYPTITKSELLEISLVTIPGQKNAVKLSATTGDEYKLGLITTKNSMDKTEKTAEQLQAELQESKKLNANMLVELHKNRGVVQAGEIDSLKKLALVDYDSVKENLEARVKEAPTATENKSDVEKAMVQLHFERGAISAEEVAVFTAAAKLDFEGTKKLLSAKAGKNNASAFVAGLGESNQSKGEGRENWTYYDYVQKDAEALSLIAKNDPDKFKRLEADFVNESKKMNIGSI